MRGGVQQTLGLPRPGAGEAGPGRGGEGGIGPGVGGGGGGGGPGGCCEGLRPGGGASRPGWGFGQSGAEQGAWGGRTPPRVAGLPWRLPLTATGGPPRPPLRLQSLSLGSRPAAWRPRRQAPSQLCGHGQRLLGDGREAVPSLRGLVSEFQEAAPCPQIGSGRAQGGGASGVSPGTPSGTLSQQTVPQGVPSPGASSGWAGLSVPVMGCTP